MRILRWMGLMLACVLVTGSAGAQELENEVVVNLDHLIHLTEPVTIDGQDMAIVHIYSEYPDYEWVDDADEGLSAVDDVARAAVVYLWEYERTGDASLLEWARRCLDFVQRMQADDGEFYNFVFTREGQINEQGITSYKSLGWWAMRGMWALGEGVRVFDTVDPAYADQLAAAYLRTESAVAATMGNYGDYVSLHGFEIPAWIPSAEPAIAGIGLLGMSAYYQARPNDATATIITQVADGISQYRLGTHSEYPFGMHPTNSNAPGFWHNWGAHMPHALVMAGIALDRQDWIDSAAAEANSFLLRQLAFEPFRHIGVVPYRLEQIAYGTNMLVQTYAALYQATGDVQYADLAALAGSWYTGSNIADTPMYDPQTGRTFDGINGPVAWRVNRNSGAESTIEGLMSMSALARLPQTSQVFVNAQTMEETLPIILQAEDGERVIGTPVYYAGTWTGEGYISAGRYVGIGEGQRMRYVFTLDPSQANEYLVYAAHVRQAANSTAFLIPRAETVPTIDGESDDWQADAALLEANTARQLLRGGGVWQGAEVDSHALRLTWDDQNLYLLADVRDPEHVQNATVSGVWQGDALWLYFTAGGDARSLAAKMTLAQTPQGGQIWDWLRTGFAEGASLAWTESPDGAGYRYEAAIPWAAIGVDNPQAGDRIGFEAGRSVGGSSFMDLTGRDPDVAANLLQLTLTEPGMDTALGETPAAALEVRINREDAFTLAQSISPDSDYWWLDQVTAQPVTLTAGEHTIRYQYAGTEGSSNPGVSKIDAFYLQPVTGRRVILLPDGRQFTLTYNTLTGDSAFTDTTP
ncbi:MAG: hypothetical protein KME04_18275 [Pleurocapsa minor GSE-CHR-MK-17-07R]|nr:hypothetical protein [Pleurocapsa minor GSE-CHR-MK 17-07R]